jgi:RND family efflux transporter MFP subunit
MTPRFLLSSLGLLVAWLVAGCSQPAPEKQVRPVKAVRVGDPSDLAKRWFPGRAKATQEVNLSFQVNGPLIDFPVKRGDKVQKGQLLARIDPQDYDLKVKSASSSVQQAEANLKAMQTGSRPEEIRQLEAALRKADADLKTAQSEYDRDETLYRTKAVSASELDRALRRLQSAREAHKNADEALRIGKTGARKEDLEAKEAEIASLNSALRDAKNRLEYTYLRAPFTGEIAETFVENFQTVQAKEPILRLLDTVDMEMTVDVPETLIHLVPQVKKPVVRFNAFPGLVIEAHVKEIGTQASRSTGTFPVTLKFEQPDIRKQPQDIRKKFKDIRILSGMSGEAQARDRSTGSTGTEIVVPLTALFSRQDQGDASYVWVLDPDKQTVSRRQVTAGEVTTLGVKVTRGLKPGEWVVTAGVHELEEGQKVTLLK